MSKISNALKMLFYLNNHDEYRRISDIASHLEIGEREVRRYRDDLEMAGFFIENKTGRYGGYRLFDKIPVSLGLSQTETLMLNMSIRTNKNVFDILNNTIGLVSKLKQDLIIGDNYIDDIILYKLVMIQKAIEDKYKTIISYNSIRYGDGEYKVEPYMIKRQRNQYYLYALHIGKLKTYNVNRITNIILSDEHYEIDQAIYDKERNENAQGIYRGEIKHKVKIEVFGRMTAYLEEYLFQPVNLIEEKKHSSVFEMETYNLHELLYSILAMASFVRIIAPEEFIKMYLDELIKMKNRNQ
ncbi:MAG: WYL domain-containing transcriptional regulator [Candidatus Izemoplasmatales bacterium]|jgi:predicted DNA-binding transcriptional regulator YafY|nr:WYL domain-containing transcriptional regulator [Candidatus Izemoplasmatales bacterium]